MATRDRQFFDIREEKAITDYVSVIADSRFTLNHELLRGIWPMRGRHAKQTKAGTVGPYDMLRRLQTLERASKAVVEDH